MMQLVGRLGMPALILLLGFANPAEAQSQKAGERPPLPWQRAEPCTDYCVPEWTVCRATPVFDRAGGGSKLTGWLRRGDALTFVRGLRIVDAPGTVVVRKAMMLKGQRYAPGDTIYVLDRQSDGDGDAFWHWWTRGKFGRGEEFWDSEEVTREASTARMTTVPGSAWWVQVRYPGNRTGWMIFDEEAIAGHAPKYGPSRAVCAA
jgi:hypothetical protein